MSCERMLVIALLGIVPRIASAQFATFIPPKPCAVVVDTVKTVVAKRAHADSVTARALTNMKAWVDSAAGLPSPSRADTSAEAGERHPGRTGPPSPPERAKPAAPPARTTPETAVPEMRRSR